MSYIGDFALEKTFDTKFTTVTTTGAPTVLAGSPVISAYLDNNTTQLTAGITLTVDFDGVVGLNNVRVVATAANGYAAGVNYQLVITTGTVGGVSVVGYVVAEFSIQARSSLRPTTADRTLDVSAGGEAGLDWANIGSPTTAQNLSATNIDVDQIVASVSGAVGSVTGAVGSVGAGGITAASLAADAITAAKIADGAIDAATFAAGAINAAAIAADAITAAKIADGAIDANTFAAGAITAAAIAADAIGAAELAADAVAEIADQVWDEVLAGHAGVGSTGAALSAAGGSGDPWSTALPGAYGAGTAGKIIGDNVNATISSRASQTSVDTIDDFLDTEVAAIKAKTDNLPADPADASDIAASFTTVNGKLDVIDDFLDLEVAAIKAVTDALPNGGALTTIQSDLDDIQLRLPAALVSGRIDASVGAMAAGVVTPSAIATDAIDSDAIAANAITEIQNGLATAAALAIVAGYIDTEIGTLQTDVSAILADTGTDGVVVATASKTGYALSAAGVDEIFDELRAGHSVAGSYGESFFTLESGAAIAGTLSTTQMSTNLTEATDDHYKGRIIIWLSGALLRQATDITAYNGTTKVLTFTALTEAPTAADKFIIV